MYCSLQQYPPALPESAVAPVGFWDWLKFLFYDLPQLVMLMVMMLVMSMLMRIFV